MALDIASVAIALVLGALVFALIWSLRLAKDPTFSAKKVNEENQKNGSKGSKKEKQASKKKPASNPPPVKENKTQFSHKWLLTTLKGHTATIQDMDLSPSGKHVATCSEELDQIVEADRPTEQCDIPTTSQTVSESVKGLSRRQKRNRNKAKASKKNQQQQQTHPKPIQPKQLSQARKQNIKQKSKAEQCPRKETPLYSNLKMNKCELYDYLSVYVLSKEKLLESGYPVESDVDPGRVIILKGPDTSISYYRTDPPMASQDQKEAYEMGDHYSRGNRESVNLAEKPPLSPSLSKRCVRCNQEFFVTVDGEYLTEESCSYHWGTKKCNRPTGDKKYTCCGKEPISPGCSTGKLHVWNGVSPGLNGPFTDYVRTSSNANHRAIYALDCEMCYTGLGLQVCKVTVVGIDGCQVYEALVKPELEVVDYNTRFSGIDERALHGTTKRLRDVQNDLTSFISAETILIGHGLENDLRSLRLLHSRVIDTAVLFPRFQNDIPFRRSLKSLVSDYLHREIQTGPNGHDSFEDARACAELILWKVMKDSNPPAQCI